MSMQTAGLKFKIYIVIISLLFVSNASAFKETDCDGLDDEPCLWKLTCFKDPDEPNKIIPKDCAQNYKEPEPVVAPPANDSATSANDKTPPAPKEKTPLEKLYYLDRDDLGDEYLTPPKEAREEPAEEEKERSIANKEKKESKGEDSAAVKASKTQKAEPIPNNDEYKGRRPVDAFRKQDEYYK
ncbi:MAG: hypothetical protein IT287_05495 [Bdellovibrionaceae bacterium]|nr:hypothetical protein [Pseudobdellovibrionaceae bacterium]